MQIVISVPDEWLEGTQPNLYDVMGAVMNGTPLPESHSDLIERSSLDVDNLDRAYGPSCELDFGRLYTQDVIEMIEKAPTIIPATGNEFFNFDAPIIKKQTATKEGDGE